MVYFSFYSRGIILWIELPWPENPANTYVRHSETLDSRFDLIKSHLQCIPWFLPLEIEPATTDCRVETLLLSQQSISHNFLVRVTQFRTNGICTTQQLSWRMTHINSYETLTYKRIPRRPDLIVINQKENLQNCRLCCTGWPLNKTESQKKDNDLPFLEN